MKEEANAKITTTMHKRKYTVSADTINNICRRERAVNNYLHVCGLGYVNKWSNARFR